MIVSEAKALLVVREGLFFLYTFQIFFWSINIPHTITFPTGSPLQQTISSLLYSNPAAQLASAAADTSAH